MSSLHPASLILLAVSFLLAAGSRSEFTLLLVCAGASLAALLLARRQFVQILRRSRWLMLTLLVLFAWMTPGTPFSGVPGATVEGLWLAAESFARLQLAIVTVAGLLTALSPVALVAGLRSLLAPLALCGDFRDRLAVRLMLTLEALESESPSVSLESPGHLTLMRRRPGTGDALIWLASTALVTLAWWA